MFRIVVNTQTSMGATGYTTGLAPSMSLGLRRLGRKHHLRQHHPAPPDQHQAGRPGGPERGQRRRRRTAGRPTPPRPPRDQPPAVDFVCEDDVRRALREGEPRAPGQARGHRDPGRPGSGGGHPDVLDFRGLKPPSRDGRAIVSRRFGRAEDLWPCRVWGRRDAGCARGSPPSSAACAHSPKTAAVSAARSPRGRSAGPRTPPRGSSPRPTPTSQQGLTEPRPRPPERAPATSSTRPSTPT